MVALATPLEECTGDELLQHDLAPLVFLRVLRRRRPQSRPLFFIRTSNLVAVLLDKIDGGELAEVVVEELGVAPGDNDGLELVFQFH